MKILIVLLCFINVTLYAQDKTPKIKFEFQTGILFGSNNTPFLLLSNQFGLIPNKSNLIYFSAALSKDFNSGIKKIDNKKKIKMAYGINIHTNIGDSNQLFLPEAYIKFAYKNIEFYAGRQKEIQGLIDTLSTSGAYLWSGNALPIPKIQFFTPNWQNFGRYQRIAFKAGISHGWFGTQGIIENYYLHQKWFYMRINNKNKKIQLMGGVNHQSQWGGYSDKLKMVGGAFPPTINGYLAPYPFYSYSFILLPFLQKFVNVDPNKVPGYDAGLAIGNQLGSVDFMANFNNTWNFYHQKPFDFARSIINLNNLEDGIYGVVWKNKNKSSFISHIKGEFIYTKSQGQIRFGKFRPSNFGEIDNYFSHGQYQSWSYKGRILGSPYILMDPNTNLIIGNRVKAFYLATGGKYRGYEFLIKATHQLNYGNYDNYNLKKSSSILCTIQKPCPKNLILCMQLSNDFGTLFGNNFGINLAVKRNLFL